MSPRRYWLTLTTALTALFACWALASPIGSVPDEYQHYKWAYAIWTGQVSPGSTQYEVPRLFTSNRISCYAFRPNVPASCDTTLSAPGLEDPVVVGTSANFYPPAYYLLTGWTLRLWPDDLGVYAGRIVGSALAAAVLAVCLTLLRAARRRAAAFGVLFCVSPMTAFFAGGYNPQILELAAATALVTGAMVLLHEWDRPTLRWPATVLLSAALVSFPLIRPLGWAWTPLLLALVALSVGLPGLRRLTTTAVGSRTARLVALTAAAALVAGFVLGLGWERLQSQASAATPGPGGGVVLMKQVVLYLFDRMQEFPQEWLGVTGSLDTFPPVPAMVLWYAALGVLVLIGLAAASRWAVLSAALGVVAVVAVTVVMEYRVRASTGTTLAQGRYVLPLVFLIIVVLAWEIDRLRIELPRRTWAVVAAVWVVVHVAVLAQSLRRNIYGLPGLPWTAPASWHPPVPAQLLLALALVAAVVVAWATNRWSSGARGPVEPNAPAPEVA